MIQSLPPIERVVTGHDEHGKAIVISQGPLPSVHQLAAIPGTVFHEVWSTQGMPVVVGNTPDPTLGNLMLPPPKRGTRMRFVDIPPDTEDFLKNGAGRMKDAFNAIGDAAASTVKAGSPHPLMHRTESVDYGILISGEIVLILDEGEAVLKPGSVVIQRGTNHAWANRTNETARMLFILIDGQYEPQLAAKLGDHA